MCALFRVMQCYTKQTFCTPSSHWHFCVAVELQRDVPPQQVAVWLVTESWVRQQGYTRLIKSQIISLDVHSINCTPTIRLFSFKGRQLFGVPISIIAQIKANLGSYSSDRAVANRSGYSTDSVVTYWSIIQDAWEQCESLSRKPHLWRVWLVNDRKSEISAIWRNGQKG